MTKPRKTDSLSDDLVSRLLDRQMAVAADYVRRGRSHLELNAAELAEAGRRRFEPTRVNQAPGSSLLCTISRRSSTFAGLRFHLPRCEKIWIG
jgi:hypothetical protein